MADTVSRIIAEHEPPGVPVPTYPPPPSASVTWYLGASETVPLAIKGERLVEIERAAAAEFAKLERLR